MAETSGIELKNHISHQTFLLREAGILVVGEGNFVMVFFHIFFLKSWGLIILVPLRNIYLGGGGRKIFLVETCCTNEDLFLLSAL